MHVLAEDDVDEVIGEGGVEPRPNDAVHPGPVRGNARKSILQDVVLQLVPPESKEELFAPSGVAGGVDVEDDGDKTPDVLHCHRLGVQIR